MQPVQESKNNALLIEQTNQNEGEFQGRSFTLQTTPQLHPLVNLTVDYQERNEKNTYTLKNPLKSTPIELFIPSFKHYVSHGICDKLGDTPEELYHELVKRGEDPILATVLVSHQFKDFCDSSFETVPYFQLSPVDMDKVVSIHLDQAYNALHLLKSNPEYIYAALFFANALNIFKWDHYETQLLLSRVYSTVKENEKRSLYHAKKAIKLSSQPWEAKKLMGKIYDSQRKITKAFKNFYDVICLIPDKANLSEKFLINIFSVAVILDHSKESIEKIIDKILPLVKKPNNFIIQFAYYIRIRDFKKGAEVLKMLSQLDCHEIIQHRQAHLWIFEKKFNEARNLLSKLKLTKEFAYHNYLWGLLYEMEGNLPKALTYYDACTDYFFNSKETPPNSWILSKCRILATQPFNIQAVNRALELLQVLHKTSPDCIEYYKYVFLFSIQSNKIEDGITAGRIYLSKRNDFFIFNKMISTYLQRKNNNEACKMVKFYYSFRLNYENPPNEEDIYYNEALIYLGLISEAQEFYERRVQNQKNEKAAFVHIKLLVEQKNYQKGIEQVQIYLQQYPHSIDLHLVKANLMGGIGNFKEAISQVSVVLNKGDRPNKISAYTLRIKIFYKQENYRKVIKDFEELLKLKPENQEDIFILAFTSYLKVQAFKKAKEVLGILKKTLDEDEWEQLSEELKSLEKKKVKVELLKIPDKRVVLPRPSEPKPLEVPSFETPKMEAKEKKVVKKEKSKPLWVGTKRMQEETQLPDLPIHYRPTLERCLDLARKNPCTTYVEENKPLPLPIAVPVSNPKIETVVYSASDAKIKDELKKRKEAREIQEAEIFLSQLSPEYEDRLMRAKNSLVSMGDILHRYKNGKEELSRYLLTHALLFNLMKICEAFYSTSDKTILDGNYLKLIEKAFIPTKIAHDLRNEARNRFHLVSVDLLIKCCESLVQSPILSNLENCLNFRKNKKGLLLDFTPFSISSICQEHNREMDLRLAIEELEWLDKIYQKPGAEIADNADYLQAVKMSICMIGKCLASMKLNNFEWFSLFGNSFAHEMGEGLRWGEVEEVPTANLLHVMRKSQTVIAELKNCFQL